MRVPAAWWIGAAVLALLPGVVGWWRGRELAARLDDPALPERIAARNQQAGVFLGVVTGLIVAGFFNQSIWAIPLAVLGHVAGAFPSRKILYGETWHLGTYLWFLVRLLVGASGFWLVLAFTPAIYKAAGGYGWLAGAAMGVVLVLWNAGSPRIMRTLVRARPVTDTELSSRFARLVETTGLPVPRLEQFDLNGGVLANAAALPSFRTSTVLMSRTIVDRFDPDEIEAIWAHELAHLEHYHPRRLRRLNVFNHLAIAGAVLFTPALRVALPSLENYGSIVWPIAVLVMLARLAKSRQQHETASDLRAITWTSNPEALIRALTKLHVIARLPRRWDADFERHATHPSLARRIQAIREAAGRPPAALGDAARFLAPLGMASVTFEDDALVWKESESVMHRFAYSALGELRVDVTNAGHSRLVATETTGTRREIALADEDIARAQAVLDIVDGRLGGPATVSRFRAVSARLTAGVAAVLALVVGQFAMLFVGLLAMLQPTRALRAAAGVAAFATAAIIWRDRDFPINELMGTWAAIAFALTGLSFVVIRPASRSETTGTGRDALVYVLAVGAGLWCVLGLSVARNVIDLHAMARTWPAVCVLPLAFAAALATRPARRARGAAAAVALAGVVSGCAGSTAFLDRLSRDPLLIPAPDPASETILTRGPIQEFSVPFGVSDIQLSPGGAFVGLASISEDERQQIHVGVPGAELTPFDADRVLFVDDRLALVAHYGEEETVVRAVSLSSGNAVVWHQAVPGLVWPRLSIDAARTTWSLFGESQQGEMRRIRGDMTGAITGDERWPDRRDDETPRLPLAIVGRDALVLDAQYEISWIDRTNAVRWLRPFQPPTRSQSRLVALSDRGAATLAESRLEVDCQPSPIEGEPTACSVFDGTRTRVIVVSPGDWRITPVMTLPGRFMAFGHGGGHAIHGWWRNLPVVLHLDSKSVIRLAESARASIPGLVASGRMLAAYSYGGQRSVIRVYDIR